MSQRLVLPVLAAFLLAFGAGCASIVDERIPGEPPHISTVAYGTVETVSPIEDEVTRGDGVELTVRLENGTAMTIVEARSQAFTPGQRVRVLSPLDWSSDRGRAEHAELASEPAALRQ